MPPLAHLLPSHQIIPPNSDRMNSPFMGNRYLLLNVKLEVLGFGHIGELQLHLKDMWELSGMPSNDFCVHRGSDGALSSTISSRTGASRLASVERFVRGVHVPLSSWLRARVPQ